MKKIIAAGFFFGLFVLALPSTAQILDSPPRDAAYDKTHILENTPLPYAYVREADVMWEKRLWRVIDMEEKINQVFYYPEMPHNQWRSLMQVIIDALKEGSITAYDASLPTDEFTAPLTFQELMNTLERADTMSLQRPYPPYDWYDTVISVTFNPSTVKKIRVKEDWFFDKHRSMLDVRILGICPVVEDYDEKGEFRAFRPLFWIYFPEARNIFAKAEVFNRMNSSNRLTYDDIFHKRIFNSYIYKEDNVFDRKISEYATGLDALLEAERIKYELFEFEQNLWEY
ncbi:MAG TPA: gliding motility protein GldN [Bacteroidales bacterium]|nr:gliding motility protein GldN [Bacteroidales bacterium]HRZ20859.1 gliding motility protein GldN [Bacteroidales bacterium]